MQVLAIPLTIISRMDAVSVGERVKRLREERRWSQRMLEARAGLGTGSISLLEAGKRTRLSVVVLGKIAAALKVPLSVVLGTDEEEAGVSSTDQDLQRLMENYLALPDDAAAKLLEESEWLRRITERAQPKTIETDEGYLAEG